MSNQTQQTPMNISPQNIAGNCTYKCDLSFDFPVSSCTATNNGNNLKLSLNCPNPPVVFNNNKYNLTEIDLFSPSLLLYNNQQSSAELLLVFNPVSGGKFFILTIPLSTNGISGVASNKISEIINAASKGAPAQGGSTNQGIADFTLNDFIPMREFYSFSYPDYSDFVSFGTQSAIYISQKDLATLQKIIKPSEGSFFTTGPKLFINKKGPVKGLHSTGSNDIYIDCQPTNSSEDEKNEVVNIKANTSYDVGSSMSNILFNPLFLLILFAIIFIILIVGINKGLKYLTGGSAGGDAGTSSS
jgi:carbonic anhydrase